MESSNKSKNPAWVGIFVGVATLVVLHMIFQAKGLLEQDTAVFLGLKWDHIPIVAGAIAGLVTYLVMGKNEDDSEENGRE